LAASLSSGGSIGIWLGAQLDHELESVGDHFVVAEHAAADARHLSPAGRAWSCCLTARGTSE